MTWWQRTSEDDGVKAGAAPQLHEVDHVPEAQRGVAREHHAGLPELTAEVPVDAGVVLQLVGLDQLQERHRGSGYMLDRLFTPGGEPSVRPDASPAVYI